jgi:hypothetical protein
VSKLRQTIRNHSEGVKMHVAANDLTIDPPAGTNSTASKNESWKIVEVLEVLLAHSIHPRDLYKNARWQTADIQFRRLRQLFDGHYKEQIHFVDALIDRIHALNGAGRVLECCRLMQPGVTEIEQLRLLFYFWRPTNRKCSQNSRHWPGGIFGGIRFVNEWEKTPSGGVFSLD